MSDARIIQRGVAKVETAAGILDAYIGVQNQTIKGKHQWDGNSVKDFGGFTIPRSIKYTTAVTVALESFPPLNAIAQCS